MPSMFDLIIYTDAHGLNIEIIEGIEGHRDVSFTPFAVYKVLFGLTSLV